VPSCGVSSSGGFLHFEISYEPKVSLYLHSTSKAYISTQVGDLTDKLISQRSTH
jgi:hypothetical protein